ncbi:hypothetical protein [Neorhizobium sp. T25_13]|nr:hypothetical protein [Neorhizobium sp. T25_13]
MALLISKKSSLDNRGYADLYSDVMPSMQANAAEQVDAAIKAAKKPAIE